MTDIAVGKAIITEGELPSLTGRSGFQPVLTRIGIPRLGLNKGEPTNS